MPFVYILYSKSKDKFYTGACEDLNSRMANHNSNTYGSKAYTSSTSDWELYLSVEVTSFKHALRLERKIKSMKSAVYIRNLKRYKELLSKIIELTK